jgi:hypothetical protein
MSAAVILISFSSISYAGGTMYQLVGRELSPGYKVGDVYKGALFIGKIYDEFDVGEANEVGYFTILLDRVDEGVEICGETTTVLSFRLVLNFYDSRRLILTMDQQYAEALWDYDDPTCPDGCIFPGYDYYLEYLSFLEGAEPNCADDGNDISLIAKVPDIVLKKQRWGSWGVRGISGGIVNGWLVHTPLLFPAVFGTVEIE